MISSEPLWDTRKRKGISHYTLNKDYKFSRGQLARMRANQNVSTHTINHLCQLLDCELSDVAKYIKDDLT